MSDFENQRPVNLSIEGPPRGKVGRPIKYTFTATDPDGDNVYLWIEWGDETSTGWFGPFDSGKGVTRYHIWSEEGTYDIKAKAEDIYGGEGDWETLTVTMPRNKIATYNSLFLRFLERFPILQKILLFLTI